MLKAFAALVGFITRLIAVLLIILFVISTVLVLLLFNIEHTLFNAETYKRSLTANHVYQQFPALLAGEMTQMKSFLANPCADNPLGCAIDGASPEMQACLTKTLGQEAYAAIGTSQRKPTGLEIQNSQPCLDKYGRGKAPPQEANSSQMGFTNNLTAEDWQALITILFPGNDLQFLTENSLDQVFAYLNGDADTARVSLVQMKKQLTGQAGLDAITLLLNAQPPCTQEQLAQMTTVISGGNGDFELCKPAKEKLADLLPAMQEQLNAVVARLPDKAVLIKPPSPSDSSGGGGPFEKNPRTTLRILHQGLRLSPLLPLGLLILVALFAVRSLKGWLRWWGIPMLISGLIALSIAIIALGGLEWVWITYIVAKFPPYISPDMTDLVHRLVRLLAQDLVKGIMVEAGLIGAFGLAAFVGSFFIASKKIQTQQTG